MECTEVRDQFLASLSAGGEIHWPEPVARHLEGCRDCRAEIEVLNQTWLVLSRWPEALPGEEVRARLVRRVRRQSIRESVLTASGWTPAVLASVIGVGLSLVLSLLVPYASLVLLCRQALQLSDPHAAPYLLAGTAYGVPLALGTWILRRRPLGGVLVGSLEASLLFLVILAPYVIAQCREFAPVLQVAFISGLAGGAVIFSLAGLCLSRLVSFSRLQQ